MNTVQFVGMNKGRGTGSDESRLALNGHSDVAFYQQEEFFVLVAMGRVRLTARGQGGFVHFKVLAGVQCPIENRAGFVGAILFDRQVGKGFTKEGITALSNASAEEAASSGNACSRERRVVSITRFVIGPRAPLRQDRICHPFRRSPVP